RPFPHLRRSHLCPRWARGDAREWFRAITAARVLHPTSRSHRPLRGEHGRGTDARGGGVPPARIAGGGVLFRRNPRLSRVIGNRDNYSRGGVNAMKARLFLAAAALTVLIAGRLRQ